MYLQKEEKIIMRLYDRINNGDVYIIAEMSANHAGKIENGGYGGRVS